METNLLMGNESDITWYLDSNPSGEGSKDELAAEIRARQPWRSHWPPSSQEMLESWLHCEFPEVLSWRFDRTVPFDRPWRKWTRSSRAMEEIGTELPRRQLGGGKTISICHGVLPVEVPQSANQDFDGLLNSLKLPSVSSAIFQFLVPLDVYNIQKPYLSRLPSGTHLARTNIATESRAIKVFDVSGHESFFTLEKSGFQFAKCPIEVPIWTDSYVCSEYLPRMEEWLVQYLTCTSAFIYAYNFRGTSPVVGGSRTIKRPFLRAHCDATAASCFKRLQLYFPDEAHAAMEGRVRFLNIWQKITKPDQTHACDSPLALCDFRTVAPEDLVAADIIFPHYQDEAYEVTYNSNQRWFYKKKMDWDDVLLFKLGDNAPDEAPLCPHSAFMDPSVPSGTPGRESVEIRAIILG